MFDLSPASYLLLQDDQLFSQKTRIPSRHSVLVLSSTLKLTGILLGPSIMLTTLILAAATYMNSLGTFIPGEWLGRKLLIFGISSKPILSSCCQCFFATPMYVYCITCSTDICLLRLLQRVSLTQIMATQHSNEGSPDRIPGSRRKVGYTRQLWRRRAKRVTIPKTPMEKARIAVQRQEKKACHEEAYAAAEEVIMEEATKLSEKFGRQTPQQCYRSLLQRARISQKKRSVSSWNAYLRREARRKNDGKEKSCSRHPTLIALITAELPVGDPRLKASAYVSEISATWNELSKEEKAAVSADAMEELQDHRENKITAQHNMPLNAFQDTRATLNTLQKDVST
jgi:hypothetical protein